MAESLEKLADRAPPAGPRASIPGAEVTSQEAVPSSLAAETTPEQAVPPKPVSAGESSSARSEAAPAGREKVS
jgi:hypothetical protein